MKYLAEERGDVVYGIEDKVPPLTTALFVLQHLASFMAMLIFPLLICRLGGADLALTSQMIAMTLVGSALATLLLAWPRLGVGYLAPASASVAFFLPAIITAQRGGVALASGMVVVGGLFQMVLTPLIRRFRWILTPLLAGLITFIMGFWLCELGVRELFQQQEFGHMFIHRSILDPAVELTDPVALTIGLFTLLVMCCVRIWSPTYLRPFSLVFGLAFGLMVALFTGRLQSDALATWFELPWIHWPMTQLPKFAFSLEFLPSFLIAGLLSALYIFPKLGSIQYANHLHKGTLDMDRIRRGALLSGAGVALSALIGGTAQSLEPKGIAMNHALGIYSRRLAYPIALVLLAFAFVPRIAWIFTLIPASVNGAAMIFMGVGVVIIGLRMIDFERCSQAQVSAFGVALVIAVTVAVSDDLYSWLENHDILVTQPMQLLSLVAFFIALPVSYGLTRLRKIWT